MVVRDTRRSDGLGVYVHVPFCARRCSFCAFYLVIQEEHRIRQFVEDVIREIGFWGTREDVSGFKISTVYFGGGTPTTLAPEFLSRILHAVSGCWEMGPDLEITVESTPELLNSDYAQALRQLGVSRLSIGVQSFDPRERQTLGMDPPATAVWKAVREARGAGLENINLDLIYGIPGQSIESWKKSMDQALALEPTHLSCYALALETGTRLYHQWRRGAIHEIDQDVEMNFQSVTEERLGEAGFARYEISNWSKPGHVCRHNLRYWQGQDYLGLGPSAQSYLQGGRWGNVPDVLEYSQRLAHGEFPIQGREILPIDQQRKERVIFGLRKTEGVPLQWVHDIEHDVVWVQTIERLLEQQYLSQCADRYCLTAKGRQYADSVGLELWG